MAMRGFDPKWRDLPDFDPREERGSATLRPRLGRGCEDSLVPPGGAVRWPLRGRRKGRRMSGPSRGAEVFLRGAGHAERGPRGIRRGDVLFDEVHVRKQILLHRGRA